MAADRPLRTSPDVSSTREGVDARDAEPSPPQDQNDPPHRTGPLGPNAGFTSHPVPRRAGLSRRLFTPVDVASVAVFRIAFGAILVGDVWHYFSREWIAYYYLKREVQFT